MIAYDKSIGIVLRKKFRSLEVLDGSPDDGDVPEELLEGDCVGARLSNRDLSPSTIVIGKLGIYLKRSSWKPVPFDAILFSESNIVKTPEHGKVFNIWLFLTNGELECLETNEYNGLLHLIFKKCKNYRWKDDFSKGSSPKNK